MRLENIPIIAAVMVAVTSFTCIFLHHRIVEKNDTSIESFLKKNYKQSSSPQYNDTSVESLHKKSHDQSSPLNHNLTPTKVWTFEGMQGEVIDPSVDRLRPWSTSFLPPSSCPIGGGPGIEDINGFKALEKIRIGVEKSQREITKAQESGNTQPRILCLVYTVEHRHVNLRAVADTWGRKCDGFIGISNVTDHSIGAVAIPHHGDEHYKNMWQKLRSTWKYAYDNFRDEYDYFYACGDDTYVVMDNFRTFLESETVQKLKNGFVDDFSKDSVAAKHTALMRPRPLLLGRPKWDNGRARVFYMYDNPNDWPIFNDPENVIWNVTGYDHFTSIQFMGKSTFPIGGPGYVLNRAALDIFVEKAIPRWRVKDRDPREDFFTGQFFEFYGVQTSDTRDEEGNERFRCNPAEGVVRTKKVMHPTNLEKIKDVFGIEHRDGIDSVSERTISFHLRYPPYYKPNAIDTTSWELIYRYHSILHNMCTRTEE